jgi:hypothetical protein
MSGFLRGILRTMSAATLAVLAFPGAAVAGTPEAGLSSPANLSSAADVPPDWDLLGTTGFTETSEGIYKSNVGAYSHGGLFHACVTTTWTGKADYVLHEYDEKNADEQVGGPRTQTAGGCETWDVDAYVDGDNGKAELYLVTNDPGKKTVTFYD